MQDLEKDEAFDFLRKYLRQEVAEEELSLAYGTIGGRISDIEGLVHRCNSGTEISRAVSDVIRGADFEIRRHFGHKMWGSSTEKVWTQAQLWSTIKALVVNPVMPYDEILVKCFSGDNQAMTALVRAHILDVVMVNQERMITAKSPLYLAAFRELTQNIPLSIKLDIWKLRTDRDSVKKAIDEIESELISLWKAEKASGTTLNLKGLNARRKSLDERLLHLSEKIQLKEEEITRLEKLKY